MSKDRQQSEDGQFGLIAMVLALAIVGVLTAVALGAFSSSGPGTASLDAAQGTLQTAAQLGEQAGAGGHYGLVSASILSSTGGSGITFTSGPSTSSNAVSVAASGSSTGGSATLAAYATGGTCWYIWLGPGGPIDGAELQQSSCQASVLPTAPATGTSPSATAIGWKSGGFPHP